MNLTELQVELRSIEEHISQLHSEIEKMKPKTEEQKKMDFEAVTKLAKKYPIKNPSIANAPEVLKKELTGSLAYLILIGENDLYSRLLYLCRFALGCRLNLSAEDIFKYGLELKPEDIEKYCIDLAEYKYIYLIEAFILANLSEEARTDILSTIAAVAQMMQCGKEEIHGCAQIAKSKLTGNTDFLYDISLTANYNWNRKLCDYIPKQWIVSQRIKCADICIAGNAASNWIGWRPCEVKKSMKGRRIVKKGDPILAYDESVYSYSPHSLCKYFKTETKTVTAPCDGRVFYIESDKQDWNYNSYKPAGKYLEAYVVSYFDDYDAFCKWHKSKRKMNRNG